MSTRVDRSTELVTAMVAYDTPEAGRRAKALLHRVLAKLDDDLTLDVRLWRFDLLDLAGACQDAHADAAVAEVFVVAFAGNSAPKDGLKRLVQGWAEERRTGDAALVAMPAKQQTDGDLIHFLRQAAENNSVRFLFSGDGDISLGDMINLPRLDHPIQNLRRYGSNE